MPAADQLEVNSDQYQTSQHLLISCIEECPDDEDLLTTSYDARGQRILPPDIHLYPLTEADEQVEFLSPTHSEGDWA